MKRITSNILRTNPEAVESLAGFILIVDNYPTFDEEAIALASSLGFTQIGGGRLVGVDDAVAEYTFERTEPLPATTISELTYGDTFTIGDDLTVVYEYQGEGGRVKNYMYESTATYVETDLNIEVNPT